MLQEQVMPKGVFAHISEPNRERKYELARYAMEWNQLLLP
jgi:hypothetical protein